MSVKMPRAASRYDFSLSAYFAWRYADSHHGTRRVRQDERCRHILLMSRRPPTDLDTTLSASRSPGSAYTFVASSLSMPSRHKARRRPRTPSRSERHRFLLSPASDSLLRHASAARVPVLIFAAEKGAVAAPFSACRRKIRTMATVCRE